MLEAVLPYLVLKAEQARIYLRFRGTIGKGGRGKAKLTDARIAERDSLMSEIQGLNRRKFNAVVSFRRAETHKESAVA
jgi:hypothetical protein